LSYSFGTEYPQSPQEIVEQVCPQEGYVEIFLEADVTFEVEFY
jgi:hypothetical protein